jgi:hypothetical protein
MPFISAAIDSSTDAGVRTGGLSTATTSRIEPALTCVAASTAAATVPRSAPCVVTGVSRAPGLVWRCARTEPGTLEEDEEDDSSGTSFGIWFF